MAVPTAVGVVAAMVTRVQAPTTNAYAQTRLWIVALVVGLATTATLVVVDRARHRARGRVQAARAEALEAAAAEHRRFLLRLDHELKNPVTAIQAGVANLDGDSAAARSVATQAKRLADLVADLRKLAELETRPLERDDVDLAEMLVEVHEAAAELPGAGDRILSLVLPQAPWPLGTVPGDRDLLFLAIHNLVVNAVKFSHPGDRIELRAREDSDQVVVEVADTGIGIPGEEVDHIWGELARGRAAAGTPGSGLGLALARVVVARHGGTVSVRSRVGDGTLIGFRLPAR
jgi:two-component system OmpR family sensor kinase